MAALTYDFIKAHQAIYLLFIIINKLQYLDYIFNHT